MATYDVECAGRWDHDFYLARARSLKATSLVDLGCGTGVFATDAAATGIATVGVDPSPAMLAAARRRDTAGAVTWLLGGADVVASDSTDLVVMMGHVAQYFAGDDEWPAVLAECHRALRPGGHLTFETRNPAARAWERWTKPATYQRLRHPDGGWFETWVDLVEVAGDPDAPTETHAGHTVLPGDEHVVAHETLRFRSPAEIVTALDAAGFTIESLVGGWDGSPFTDTSPEMIVLARR